MVGLTVGGRDGKPWTLAGFCVGVALGRAVGVTVGEADGADDEGDEVPVVGYGVGLTEVDVDGVDDGLDVGFLVLFALVGLTVGGRDGNPWTLAGF